MKLQHNVPIFSRTALQQVLLTALTYWFFLALTNYALMQLPWLQLRFATFVPVVSGIMFGLPGAVGAALGCAVIGYCAEEFFGLGLCISAPLFWLLLALCAVRTRSAQDAPEGSSVLSE